MQDIIEGDKPDTSEEPTAVIDGDEIQVLEGPEGEGK